VYSSSYHFKSQTCKKFKLYWCIHLRIIWQYLHRPYLRKTMKFSKTEFNHLLLCYFLFFIVVLLNNIVKGILKFNKARGHLLIRYIAIAKQSPKKLDTKAWWRLRIISTIWSCFLSTTPKQIDLLVIDRKLVKSLHSPPQSN